MPEITRYAEAFYPMTWNGPRGYPEDTNSGRCYITGMLGMLHLQGEDDVLFADGTSGDGFSFRWCPAWGAPAFNGGAGPFHELWEYTPPALGFQSHWQQDPEGKILIPGSLPFIITGVRLTYGVGWRVIVGAEMISSITGLGFMIDDARWQLRPDVMVAGMITIAMIGWIMENWAFDWLERVTIERWGMKTAPR